MKTASMAIALLIAVCLALLAVACEEGGDEATATPATTATASAIGSPSALPASTELVAPNPGLTEDAVVLTRASAPHSNAAPALTPTSSPGTSAILTSSEPRAAHIGRIFFLRPPDEPWTPDTDYWEQLGRGDLWMANTDGSGEQQITFGKANGTFAGFLIAEDGPTLYYTSGDGTTFHLWRKALESGEETEVLSFSGWPYWRGGDPRWSTLAAVSPDGQYAALVEVKDIVLADLATGERRTLFESNYPDCEEISIVSCVSYSRPHWSPDGSLLAVQHTRWESGGQFIVDPFEPFAQPSVYGPFDIPYVEGRLDWKTSEEACTTAAVGYGASGLYLIHGPDWAFDPYEAEDISGYCPDFDREFYGDVQRCAWLDDRRIAFFVSPYGSGGSSRIEVIDVDTREITTLAEFTDEGSATQIIDMFVLRDEGLIVYNRLHYVPHEGTWRRETFTTAGLIRVGDGSHQPILRERDHIIGVVPGFKAK